MRSRVDWCYYRGDKGVQTYYKPQRVRVPMRTYKSDTSIGQEVATVSPTSRGDRVVVTSPRALSLLGLLGLSLLLLGRLPV